MKVSELFEKFDQFALHSLKDPQSKKVTPVKSTTELAAIIKANCGQMLEAYKKTNRLLWRGMSHSSEVVVTNIRPDRKPVEMDPAVHDKLHDAFLAAGLVATRKNSIFCTTRTATAEAWGSRVYALFVKDGWTGTVFTTVKTDYSFYQMSSIGRYTDSIEDMAKSIKAMGAKSFNTATDLGKILRQDYRDILITGESYIAVEIDTPEYRALLDALGLTSIKNEEAEQSQEHALLEAAKRDPERIREAYSKWRHLVNMPTKTLEKFLGTEEGRAAGLSPKEAKKAGGIKTGRGSARAIIRMRSKPFSEWSSEDINWMFRQISFVSRMTGLDGPLFKLNKDGKKVPTRKLTSLWVWGHNPAGHSPGKYGVFK